MDGVEGGDGTIGAGEFLYDQAEFKHIQASATIPLQDAADDGQFAQGKGYLAGEFGTLPVVIDGRQYPRFRPSAHLIAQRALRGSQAGIQTEEVQRIGGGVGV